MEHIEIAHWAGLGGVSYLPMDFRPKMEEVEITVESNDTVPSEPVNTNSDVEPSVSRRKSQCKLFYYSSYFNVIINL